VRKSKLTAVTVATMATVTSHTGIANCSNLVFSRSAKLFITNGLIKACLLVLDNRIIAWQQTNDVVR